MDNKITLICNQCGSNDVMQESDDTYVCRNCGSKFKISQQVVNVFHTEVNGAVPQEDKNPVYLVTKEMSADEFVKKALINIAKNKDIPEDIFENTKFENAHKFYSQFLVMNVNYTGTYSASIGYDREEMYEDYEEKYDKDLGRNIRQKVMKKRTVTDWKPHSGMINQNIRTCVRLEHPEDFDVLSYDKEWLSLYFKNDIDFLEMQGEVEGYSKDTAKKIKVHVPTEDEQEFAIFKGEDEIKNQIRLPGDHVKDFSTSVSETILSKKIYLVPTWEIQYDYNGEDYCVSSLAYDNRFANNNVPSDSKNIKREINKKTSVSFVLSLSASLIAIIASLLIWFVFKKIEYRFIPIGLICLSILFFVIYILKHKNVTNQVINNRFDNLIYSLNGLLLYNDLKELTILEEEEISKVWGKK